MKRLICIAAITALAGAALAQSRTRTAEPPDRTEPRRSETPPRDADRSDLLERAAALADRAPTDFVVLDYDVVTLPGRDDTGVRQRLAVMVLVERRTGRIVRITLDTKTGAEVDYDGRLDEVAARARKRLGNISPALAAELRRRGDEDPAARIPVLVRMNIEPRNPIDRRDLGDADPIEQAMTLQQINETDLGQQLQDLVVADPELNVLRRGPDPVRVGPFLHTSLTASEIKTLGRKSTIRSIDLTDLEITSDDEIDLGIPIVAALPATRTDAAHSMGALGADVNVAVLEPGAETSECFHILKSQTTFDAATASEHATKSSGIIGSTHDADTGGCNASPTGYAPKARLLLANAGSVDEYHFVQAYKWTKAHDVDVVSVSWQLSIDQTKQHWTGRDKFFDWAAMSPPYPLLVLSAGRTSPLHDQVAAWGHNVLSVANVLMDGDADRHNFAMAELSPGNDPASLHGDRELPALAAPGSTHKVLGKSFGGTSAATPVVASIAALVIEQSRDLRIYPEAVRAILLASADAQGADGQKWTWSETFEQFDGRDGTGVVNAERAVAIARQTAQSTAHAHDFGAMDADAFDEGFFKRTWSVHVPNDGDTLRICLAWSSPEPRAATSGPQVNLDLLVYGAGDDNIPIAVSMTKDESYEFIELPGIAAGTYQIRVQSFDADRATPTYYGIAWTVLDAPLS